ncbi:MAG TPA: N-acetylmuramoyl-L-alanine amidase [Calditerricola sp.]
MPKIVVLDPGHGCDTPGKRSPDGSLREYEFNGDVASRAKKLLEDRGIKVILTRSTAKDAKDVSLSKRVAVANQAKADLFISIHANAHGNGRAWTTARGYEVWIYAPGGEREVLAKRLLAYAGKLLKPMDPDFPLRGIKHNSSFYVLKHTKMAAALVEHAFMTNPRDCALLKSDEFRQKAAEHIARAVCEHLGIAYDQPAAAPKPAATGKPVLRRGSEGDAVRELQEALKRLGHDPGPIDGIFGPRTEAAVKLFQRDQRIAVDGIVGPVTWGRLDAALKAKQQRAPAPKQQANGKVFRVVIGSFSSRPNAEALAKRAKQDGYEAWILEG